MSEVLQSGLIMESPAGMKKRQRSIYWKKVTVKGGDMIWMQTMPLPSDIQGQAYYLSKGFRLKPPDETEPAPEVDKDEQIRNQIGEIARLTAQLAEANKKNKKKPA